jgi:hypothetical protein
MATEESNSQPASIQENGENKKRKEKRTKLPGTEVKPIRKVALDLSDGGKLRRLLIAHEAMCGETLTALTSYPLSSIVWRFRSWSSCYN